MKIINEIKVNNSEVIRLFRSNTIPRKNNMRIHHHTMIELSLILNGNGIYKTATKSYNIVKGDIFLFRPNEAHCITDTEEDGMELLNIHVSPSYLYTNFPNALNSEYTKILSARYPLISNKVNDNLSKEDVIEIQNLFYDIKKEFEFSKSDHATVIINAICTILIKISRIHNDIPSSSKEQYNYQKIIAAISYINERFSEPLTLQDIASKIGYSRCYFSNMFNKCMGMSVWDYICIKRIEKALTLIKTTNKNILQIATECGFNNSANFNKTFKKYTNLLPHSFR